MSTFILRQAGQGLEQPIVMGVVGVVLDLGQGEELRAGEGVGYTGRRLPEVYFSLSLRE